MMRLGQDKIEEVRTRADLVEVVGAHVRLRRAGRNFVGLCPFHQEKTPSFNVNPERAFFHCFGCGAGGTVFDFVMRVEGLSFPEALQSLARRYGIALPETGDTREGSPNQRDACFNANQVAAEFYAHVLWNTPDGELARDYLKSRGITCETARAFLIGFAPQRPANLATILQKRGLVEPALKLGLVKKDASGILSDMFRARLMFPIRDTQGRVVGFGGRVLDNRLPKYINSAESPVYSKTRVLYGLHEARPAIGKSDRAVLVEGYIDVIALWQAGFKDTVATSGTALTVAQLRLLSRYTRNIIACFDGDAAGRQASMRALEVFLQAGLLGHGAFIPRDYDPDTLIRDRGTEAFRQVLESGEMLADFFIRQQALSARESVDARARAAERVTEMLRMVANPFEFDIMARKAAGLLGIGEEVLRREARRTTNLKRPPVPAPSAAPRRLDASGQATLGLVALALRYGELRVELKKRLPEVELPDGTMRSLLEEVCASDESSGSLEVMVMSRLDEEQRKRLSAMMVGPLENEAEKAALLMNDFIKALAQGQDQREVAELRRAAATGDGDEAAAAAQAIIARRRASRQIAEKLV
jgi:DNA primase